MNEECASLIKVRKLSAAQTYFSPKQEVTSEIAAAVKTPESVAKCIECFLSSDPVKVL